MKIIPNAVLVTTILLSLSDLHAASFTLTVVTNPPEGGTITGAGTYSNGATADVEVSSTYGWYINELSLNSNGSTHFEVQLRDIALGGLEGKPADYTTITNDSESLTLSSNLVLTVSFKFLGATVLASPQNEIIVAGQNVSLTGMADGRGPLSYQWYKDGQMVTTGTSSNLTFATIQASDSGTYWFVVTNVFGQATSAPATVIAKDLLISTGGPPTTNSPYTAGGMASIFLSSKYPNGSIFYTLDGSEPDFNSTPYQGSLYVYSSCILRAIAYSPDFSQSVMSDPFTIIVLPTYELFISTLGGGDIGISPSSTIFMSNTVATLTAVPWTGWTFMGWSGDASGADITNTVVMNSPKNVQATFGTAVSTTVTGKGTVTMSPTAALYPFESTVQLVAVPNPGSYFGVWGNAASGNQNPASISVTSTNPTVSALFALLPANQAALTVLPDGGGQVTVHPTGNRFDMGKTNMLTAVPIPGQQFLGWDGDANGTANPLALVMDGSKVVTAHFTRMPQLEIDPFHGIMARLSITGVLGDTYRIDASSNLPTWTPLVTLTNFFGTVPIFDPDSETEPHRMYRAVVTH